MCNASIPLMNIVENEVLQRMQAKDTFTALDVSNALKIAKYPVRHRDVAEVVRDIYNSGAMAYYDYDRQLMDVTTDGGTKTAQAYLYHHQTARVGDYAALNQDALPPVPANEARDMSDCVAADPLGLLNHSVKTGTAGQAKKFCVGFCATLFCGKAGRRAGDFPPHHCAFGLDGWRRADGSRRTG